MPEHDDRYGAIRPPEELNPRREAALDFADRPLKEMTAADYDAIGFLSGLEVHQQLRTPSKLFCRCPAGRRADRADAEVLRHMRPTLSELGEYDGTALMEFKTRKEIVYLLERGTVCTYEMDDTPPFPVDDDAVRIAVELALLFDLKLVSELHVMRKQYLDGSIPTGFQRTAMVGVGGSIPFRVPELGVDRPLSIRQLSLEEDSCREVSDLGHRIVFRADRLGVPLTEVVTEPELRTPWELQAAARLIARTARATGHVRRGAGAARQDVNVSVAGGRRVEIKGVPRHRGLPLLVHIEAFRQLALLRVKAELERRGVTLDLLPLPGQAPAWEASKLVVDASSILARTGHAPLRRALERGDTAVAVRLPGFAGLLDRPAQPGIPFGHELAERVRVIACPIERPFTTWANVGAGAAPVTAGSDAGGRVRAHPGAADLSRAHWRAIEQALGAEGGDAMIVAWAPAADADTAAREILIRAREALAGVPAETRQARADGTTGFERILPGADRMYPDTDTPPLPIADALIERVVAELPETPWARADRYTGLGLDVREAQRLSAAPWADLFDDVAPEAGDVARTLARALQHRLPFHARRSGAAPPSPERLRPLVRALEDGDLLPAAMEPALDALVTGPEVAAAEIVARFRASPEAATDVETRIPDAAARARNLGPAEPAAAVRRAMGEVMRGYHGRVDAADVRRRVVAALGFEVEAA